MLACLPLFMPTCKSYIIKERQRIKRKGESHTEGSKVRKIESERKRKGREKGRTIYSSLS